MDGLNRKGFKLIHRKQSDLNMTFTYDLPVGALLKAQQPLSADAMNKQTKKNDSQRKKKKKKNPTNSIKLTLPSSATS